MKFLQLLYYALLEIKKYIKAIKFHVLLALILDQSRYVKLLNIAHRFYSILMLLLLPVLILRLLWRSLKLPVYRQRLMERIGFYGDFNVVPGGILVHAVSVGEVVAALPLIKAIQTQYPDLTITVTTTTPTGSQRVKQAFGDKVAHIYLPYDMNFAVRRFLQVVQPSCAVIMETEIWPNLFAQLKSKNIPFFIANGRISDASINRYLRVKWFLTHALNKLNCVAAQSQIDGERFVQIGLPQQKLQIAGNLKFDVQTNTEQQSAGQQLKATFGDRLVWVAASTHGGEEEQVLSAFAEVRELFPQCLLILVPRHPDRFDAVAALLAAQNINFVRRTENKACNSETAVLLGDTMGELGMYYAAADVTYVGGSLVPIGGHNLLEPAALGIPSITGHHVNNFREITALLQNTDAVFVVQNADELATRVIELLANPSLRQKIGTNALETVIKNRGAIKNIMQIISGLVAEKGARYQVDTCPSELAAAKH